MPGPSVTPEKTASRPYTCRHSRPQLNGTIVCLRGDAPVACDKITCDNCPGYKSRYIQYPITVSGIDIDDLTIHRADAIGRPVAVRPCDPSLDGKTYLGIYLGEHPWILSAAHNEQTERLAIRSISNPMMYIPELKRLVYGAESWWMFIETPEDLKQITDADINSVWYVQLLKSLSAQSDT